MVEGTPRYARVGIGSIVIRCFEYERMVAFWRAALGYELEHADPNGGFVILRDPDRRAPNVSLDQAPVRRTGKRSLLHLDLYTTNQSLEAGCPGSILIHESNAYCRSSSPILRW